MTLLTTSNSTIKPTIYVDARERPSGLSDLIRERGDIEVIDRWLPYGDLLISDILIERKTTADFVSSLNDGRLFRQLSALLAFSARRLLIVEGLGFPSAKGVSNHSIEGALIKIEIGMQVPIFNTATIAETAQLITRIVAQESRTMVRMANDRSKRRKKEVCAQARALRAVPDLNPATSRLLLQHFRTLRNIFNASAEELVKVGGLSEERAQTVFRFATEPPMGIEGNE